MIMRHLFHPLTTVEEDFRRIGLLPMTEEDDPTQPRDIPSPAPETEKGLDDSEGEKSAHQSGAKQPKPSMGPADETDDEYEPVEDGGSKGAVKQKAGYKVVPHGKEASIKGEGKETAYTSKYTLAKKQPKKLKGGQKPQIAKGLPPTKKIGGMKAEGAFSKAANLIEEVEGLLYGVQMDEEYDRLIRGFYLVCESSALLADRLTEISDKYEVEDLVGEMEELSQDAAQAHDEVIDVYENGEAVEDEENVENVDVEEDAEKDHDSEKPYDIPSPAPGTTKEAIEGIFTAMVGKLMDALEAYDGALGEGALGAGLGATLGNLVAPGLGGVVGGALGHMATGEEAGDDGEEEHVPGKTIHAHHRVVHHVHHEAGTDDSEHGGEDDDQGGEQGGEGEEPQHAEPDADNAGGPSDHDADNADDQDGEQGDEGGEENPLAARLAKLRHAKEAAKQAQQFPPKE